MSTVPIAERVRFSPIKNRPKLVWPDGNRIALWVVPNVEHYEYLPHPVRLRDPWRRTPHPDVLGYSTRDYGNRVGLWRMLEVIDEFGVKCTTSLNVAVYHHFPEVMEACESRNWEVMSHGIYNTQFVWGLSEEEERELIADCVDTIFRLTGKKLVGWFSPAGTYTLNTPDLLAEAGIKYYCDWHHDDQPFPMKVRNGSLITMPYQLDVNDAIPYRYNIESDDFARMAIDHFDQLYEESADNGRVMCLPIHPYIIGQPHRVCHLRTIFEHIFSHSGVWNATGAEIADYYIRNYLPRVQGAENLA